MTTVSPSLTLRVWHGRRILALLCAVAFLDFVDASITNVALPHIMRDLGFSVQSLQWVPSAYLLTYGGFMLLGGRLADLLGRRDVLLAGTALLGLSSLAGGFAGNTGVFVAARLVQGLGAALMLPAALSTLTTTFTTSKDRHSALGVWAGVAGLASAVGILAGGLLTDGLGWRWVMFVNPIACVLVIPAVLALLPRDRPAARTTRFDLLGSAVVTAGTLLLVYALVKAPDQGWAATRTWLELAGAAALLASFVLVERTARDPILPLDIFRVPGLLAANLTGLIGFAGMLSMFYFLTLYMQTVLGYSAIAAGAAYLPLTAGVGVGAGVGARLLARVGSRAVICVGALVAAAGLFLLSRVPAGGGYLAHILPGLLLVAFGVGPVFVGVTSAANAGVGPSRAGLAAAILNSTQQIGGALGLAIFSAAGAARTHHLLATGSPASVATTSGLGYALGAGAAFAVAAAIVALATVDTHEGEPPMTRPERVLVVGRSPNVLIEAVDLLRADGYVADATNQFDRVLDDYDVTDLDVLVFGGMVPADTKQRLRDDISARNPGVTFVQGLAGIPGLIAAQVRAATSAAPVEGLGYDESRRAVLVTLDAPAAVTVDAWWGTTFTPPEPRSASARVFEGGLDAGSHVVALPAEVPSVASFAGVTVGGFTQVFMVGPMPDAVTRLAPTTAGDNGLPEVGPVTT
ncbi:MFS transporter [Asanoa sp. NPDC049573]|uniref:MFS transporter n=1 Tax=Asanoa sp. NPDC049573 TaxID=3155396 RepID=UPI003419A4CE